MVVSTKGTQMPSSFVLASEEDVLARIRSIDRQLNGEPDAGFRAALVNTHIAHWDSMRERVASWMADGDDASDPPMVPVFNVAQCDRVLGALRAHLRRLDASIRMRLIVNGFGDSHRTAAE